MKHLVVLSGAGMSAESGIRTFRDAGGLWEGHDVMEVASPQGWEKNPALVLDFYNMRRRQLLEVEPNEGHRGLVALEQHFRVSVITQNVDDLHERAGSTSVLHLHGELFKVRSTCDENDVRDWKKDLLLGDTDENGCQLRPHIVWFGEPVPMMSRAVRIAAQADIFVIIGTSMQVYPAAGLVHYLRPGTPVYYIDPEPAVVAHTIPDLTIIRKGASDGVRELLRMLAE